MVKRKSQSDHDRMVKAVAVYLANNGYGSVKADIAGYQRPPEIKWKGKAHGHIPDATANGIVIEVETADSIDDAHTKDQWKLFDAFAKENNETFIVVVPKGSKAAANRRLGELSVTAKVWVA